MKNRGNQNLVKLWLHVFLAPGAFLMLSVLFPLCSRLYFYMLSRCGASKSMYFYMLSRCGASKSMYFYMISRCGASKSMYFYMLSRCGASKSMYFYMLSRCGASKSMYLKCFPDVVLQKYVFSNVTRAVNCQPGFRSEDS